MAKKIAHYVVEFQNLMSDWDFVKNIHMKPETTATGSNKKVWWKCAVCGHEWLQSPNIRRLGGCPACSHSKGRQKVIAQRLAQEGSLAVQFPELMSEWDFKKNDINPDTILPQKNVNVWWKCATCGYEWKSILQSRTRKNGTGCPVCGEKKAKESQIKNRLNINGSLIDTHPKILKEWDYEKNTIDPHNITCQYSKPVHWICGYGHEWEKPVNLRIRLNINCPICAKQHGTSFSEQTLFYYINKTVTAESRYLINGVEIDIYIPSLKIGIEYDGIFFHSTKKSQAKETKKNAFCQENGIRLIRVKEADIDKIDNDIILIVPKKDYSNLYYVLQTIFSKIGIDAPLDFNIERDRFDILEQYVFAEEKNGLAKKYPDIAAQWDKSKNGRIKPECIRPGSNQKFWWKCQNGHSWIASVYSRVNGNGCPMCAGKTLVVGQNDLMSQSPELTKEWHPTKNGNLTPNMITINNGKKVWWLCKNCGYEWQATPAHRSSGRGCPICGRKKADHGRLLSFLKKNGSLADVHPELLCEWDYEKNVGINPSNITTHNGKKVWWKCKNCGYQWRAIVNNRTDKGSGCPMCAKQNLKEKKQKNKSKAVLFDSLGRNPK